MMMLRRALAILTSLAIGGLASPVHAEDDARQQLISGAKALLAHDAYQERCASCHGERGAGGSAKVDFSSPEAVARLSRDAMIGAVLHGHVNADAQQAIASLSETSAADIVDYIREILMLPAPLEDASVGRQIYSHTCSVCHGERGDAASWAQNSFNPPPFDFTSEKGRSIGRERMIHSVTYGVPGTAMMPFTTQLSLDEIAAVVDYIQASFIRPSDAETAPSGDAHAGHAAEHPVAVAEGHAAAGHAGHELGGGDLDAPFADGLVGDAEAGETFYAQNCAECHGLQGDGQGRRAYFINPKPADFTSPRARAQFNRPHLFAATSDGVRQREMPAWSKVIGPQRIADVTEYVFRAFVAPASADTAQGGPSWQPQHDSAQKKRP